MSINTICDFKIHNGAVTEQYSVVQDTDGEIFIQCCLDAVSAGPVDTMHIDRAAVVRIATALLLAVGIGERSRAVSTKVIPIRSMQDIVSVGWML